MKKFLFFIISSLALVACNPGQTALSDLEKFTNRMEQKSESWSLADWDDAAQHYDEIIQTLSRYDYSDEELQRIGQLKGRCTAYFLKHYTNQAIDQIYDAGQEFEGFLDGLNDILGE